MSLDKLLSGIKTYPALSRECTAEYKDRNSKFLAYITHVSTAEEASEYLEALKKEHYKATHHCYAFRVGFAEEVHRANDDGEPSGSAGMPILGQLRSHNCHNCIAVVIRYYGGTKLGVSGLINAYKTATATALEDVKMKREYPVIHTELTADYSLSPLIRDFISKYDLNILKDSYGKMANYTLALPRECAEQVMAYMAAELLQRPVEDIENPKTALEGFTFNIKEEENA